MPLGAIVMLSDGADNAGGIDLNTIAAIRRQRIPIHTIGFGKEHPDKDVEVLDAIVPARALPDSKLTATAHAPELGSGTGSKAKLNVKDELPVILASQEVTFRNEGQQQTETLVFNGGAAGPKTLEISVDPISGEENLANNKITRVVNVEARKPRILYIQGEPVWNTNSSGARSMTTRTSGSICRRCCALRRIRSIARVIKDPKELEDGFPTKPEELFAYQGLIIGGVEASYFTPTQQQAIHDFVDRRGGGLLFIAGRASLSDGGWQNSPMAELVPVKLPEGRGTFHRDFSSVSLTSQGAQSVLTRLDENPAHNAEMWKKIPQIANYQDVGEPKPGATMLMTVTPPAGKRPQPLLVTENFGRGRTALFATEGSWRWKMWLDHADKTHATFWQQLFRHLVSDTPGQVVASTPRSVLERRDQGADPGRSS